MKTIVAAWCGVVAGLGWLAQENECLASELDREMKMTSVASQDTPAGLPASHLEGKVVFPVSVVTRLLEKEVPLTFGKTGHGAFKADLVFKFASGYDWRMVLRREALRVEVRDGTLVVTAPTRGRIQVKSQGISEYIDVDAVLEFSVVLSLNSEGKLTAKLTPAVNVQRAQMQIFGVEINLIATVRSALLEGMQAECAKIEAELAKQLATGELADAMTKLGQPILLAGTSGVPAWLCLRPAGLRVGRIEAGTASVVLPVGMDMEPFVVVGEKPTVASLAGMPAMAMEQRPTGFAIRLPVSVDYGSLNALAAKHIAGTEMPWIGKMRCRIAGLTLAGTGERVRVRLVLDGTNGMSELMNTRYSVSFSAKPVVDEATGTLRLDACDFEVGADTAAAAAMMDVLKADVCSKILSQFDAELAKVLNPAELKARAKAWRLGDWGDLVATAEACGIENVVCDDEGLSAVVTVRGQAAITLDPTALWLAAIGAPADGPPVPELADGDGGGNVLGKIATAPLHIVEIAAEVAPKVDVAVSKAIHQTGLEAGRTVEHVKEAPKKVAAEVKRFFKRW
jgi:hypothetical protein